nr:hypothetical protein [Tanacetum cinerariifolium]
MLIHQGEGSGTLTEPHHTPFPEVESSHPTTLSIPLPSIPTAPIPTVTQTDSTPIIQYSRRARIAQSSALLTVADEPASPVRDDRETNVPTGSGFIPTAGPPATVISTGSEVSPTASPIVTKRKGKEVMVESDTPKNKKLQEQINAQVARELEEQQEREDMRMNEQIARDAEVARIHAEEEIQGMIDSLDKSNETVAKYLQEYQDFASELPLEKKIELISDLKREYYMAVIKSNLGWRFKDFKGMTFEEIEAKFAEVWKQVEDFIPIGSKEESERLKRKGLNLEKEQVKK